MDGAEPTIDACVQGVSVAGHGVTDDHRRGHHDVARGEIRSRLMGTSRRVLRLVGEEGEAVTDAPDVNQAHGLLVAHLAEDALADPMAAVAIFNFLGRP
jgi:hypothetical protein